MDFDVTVTWRRADGSTVELPACVCYRDAEDTPERRAEVMMEAVVANAVDFPDDIGEGGVPIRLVFSDA